MEAYVLVAIAFFTSTLTAVIGMGGGILLISAMPGLLPAAAIIPVHGAVQLASNGSRVLLGIRHIEWRIFWPFSIGAVLGSAAGTAAVVRLSFDHLPLYLGAFILFVTWIPIPKRSFRLPGHFAILGVLQTFLSLFVGVSGPLTNAFLLRKNLPKDRLVITHGITMTATHLCKIVVFGFVGFAFAPYLYLIAAMIISATLGSWAGTKLRGRLPEELFKKIFKALISLLSIRMIVSALIT